MKDRIEFPYYHGDDADIDIDEVFHKIVNDLKMNCGMSYILRVDIEHDVWDVEMLDGSFWSIDGETENLY